MRTIRSWQMLLGLLHAAALALFPAAHAQEYPSKPIKIVIPFPPGGGVDLIARLVSDKLQAKWGQPVVSENRAGANGNIGAELVAKASPDGYTLVIATVGQFVISKLLYRSLPFDPEALVPVGVTSTVHLNLTTSSKVPANSVQELVALMKANPGRFSYASAGVGSGLHLAGELFQLMTGTKAVHVPYKGTAQVITDLVSGQVDMAFVEIHGALPHMTSGRLRVLAVGSEKRLPAVPDIPAMSETLPGFVSSTWNGVAAPPGTPAAIVSRLSAGVAEAMRQPDVMKRLTDLHVEVVGGTPAEMAQLMKRDSERWGSVIRATGATAE
jgi:tripartite-type tricarboxylate transporter receptor subunit TctC